MQQVRSPAVAGLFYPAEPAELASTVARLLDEAAAAARRDGPGTIKALIAPHAGYVYSGPVAATGFARLREQRGTVRRVLLLGPAHFVPLRGLALPRARLLATPLGTVPVDEAAAEQLLPLPQIAVSDAAHAREHSLEVELPFLQTVLRDFHVVPLAVGDAAPEEVAEVLQLLWGQEETLIVVSSDLSHYLPYQTARRRDRATADAILRLSTVASDDACGAAPLNGLLFAARKRGLNASLLDLRNSGDTAGDRASVVGYGAFAFEEKRA